MSRKKKSAANKALSPAYSLPDDVVLTPETQEDWERLTRLLPLTSGPRMPFVLVDSPVLRRRLMDHLAAALRADGHEVIQLNLPTPFYKPLDEVFDTAKAHPEARFIFLSGLERSFLSPAHRLGALATLNLQRDQISHRLACPLVIWTTDDTLTDLARHAVDFTAWRGTVFTLADPADAVEAPYRQHIIDRFGKLTLYSATADAPLAVDLEQVFVKLTATQYRVSRSFSMFFESLGPEGEARPTASKTPGRSSARPPHLPEPEPSGAVVTLALNEVLQSGLNRVVIGAPGAGKTTLLRFLALTFARRQAQERLELVEERLPLFVTLRDFSRFLADMGQNDDTPGLLPHFLTHHLKTIAPHVQVPDDFFQMCLTHGKCMVLLDGLDEVAEARQRARVAEAVAAFTRHYRGNRFVITSRPRGYEGEARQRLADLYPSCTIRDFDDADMMAFTHNWYAAVTRDRMGDTPDALAEAQRQADDLLGAIRADTRVQALAHNPLLLSVLAMVHQRGVGLPQRRAELYDECTDMLLGYWDQTKGGAAARELAAHGFLSRAEKRALLEPIALWFHERGEEGLEASKEVLEQEVGRQFQELFGDDEDTANSRATLFLQVIDERAGLLVERETGVYAFAHLTFQEYLAARAIADREDYISYTLQHLHDPWWREVLLLEVGHLSDVRQFRRARRLTSDLLRAIRDADSWLEAVLRRDFLFAVRCLCDTGRLGVDEDLRKSLIDDLITLWRTTPYEPQRQDVVDLFAYAMPTVDGERIYTELFCCLEDASLREAAVRALEAFGAAAATPEVLARLVTLTADADLGVRELAVWALGVLGAAAATPEVLARPVVLIADADVRELAATPEVLARLVALTADADSGVRRTAVLAFGGLGAATPVALGRLVTLTADTVEEVRLTAAWVLGNIESGTGFLPELATFWQAYLVISEFQVVGEEYGRVCDIAYKQLRRIAEQQGIKIG